MNKIVIAIMFSQIVPVVKTIPGKFKKYALPVLILRIGLPVRARWSGKPAFYAGEPPARLAVSSRTARLLSDPIIPFYKIQKVNSLLGHMSYGRIHNVQPAQER